MRHFALLSALATLIVLTSCGGRQGGDDGRRGRDRHQPDTGYTGVKYVIRDNVKRKEMTYRNGVLEGITRTYYKGGQLEQEIPYSEGQKNGEATWYYPDGKLFRITPFVSDTIHGDQIQYYKNGREKAVLSYHEGKRYPGLTEYTMSGEKVDNYPELIIRTQDRYQERALYKLFIEFSDMAENARFYRGDYINGLVDLDSLLLLMQTPTTGYLDLTRTPGHHADSVVVIGSYLTQFGNRLYYRKAIALPYKDLN